jgi:hypothetical protein
MMTKPYTRVHPLRWPLADLSAVTVSTVSIGTMRELRAKFNMDSPDEAKQDRHGFGVAVFRAHTGLDDEQRGLLTHPDLNSINLFIHELVMTPTTELVSHSGTAANSDEFNLLVPVVDPFRGKEPVINVTMQPPTVRLTDSVRELSEFDQQRELISSCTSLTPDTVMKLHMPDWLAMQGRMLDFLAETADYFPLQTSNA